MNTTVCPIAVTSASRGTSSAFSFGPEGISTTASIPSIKEYRFRTSILTGKVRVAISPLGTIAVILPWISFPAARIWTLPPLLTKGTTSPGTSTMTSMVSSRARVPTAVPGESHSPRSTVFLRTTPSKGARTAFFDRSSSRRSTSALRDSPFFSRDFTRNRVSSYTCSAIESSR